MRRLLAPVLVLAACGGPVTSEPPPPGQEPAPLVLPTAVSAVVLAEQSIALPSALLGQPLQVATLPGVGTLVGGAGGLYELSAEGLTLLDATPVVGLARYGEVVVVAHAHDLALWNGSLAQSQLSAAFADRTVSALAADGDALYVGSEQGLDRFQDQHLEAFMVMASPTRILGYAGGRDLVVEAVDASISALRTVDGQVEQQVLNAQQALSAVAPGLGDRLYAIAEGKLYERQSVDATQVRYRPVALAVDAVAGAEDLEALTVDPQSGFVWAVGPRLLRLENGRLSTLGRPAGLGRVQWTTVTEDGALWLSDGSTLWRVGNEGPPVTWAGEIGPFHQANCQRCHAPLGTAHPLESYEAWSSEINQIIDAVGTARMPQDGRSLVGGTVELLRRWQADGLRP